MVIGAAIAAVAVVASVAVKSRAERKAAQRQREQQDKALFRTEEGIKRTQEEIDPFRIGGQKAFDLATAQSGALGPEAQAEAFKNFTESPGVKFFRDQGIKAIDRNAAARGRIGSGTRLKSLTEFSQGLAEQDFGNQFNRLTGLGKQGQSAAVTLAQARGQNVQQQSNILQNIGQTEADSRRKRGEILAEGIEDLGSIASSSFGGGFGGFSGGGNAQSISGGTAALGGSGSQFGPRFQNG